MTLTSPACSTARQAPIARGSVGEENPAWANAVFEHIAGLDALVDKPAADAGNNANVEMAENPVHDEAAPRAVISEAEAPAPPPHRDSAVV